MGSLLALAFIGGVAAVGIFVGTRPTVADGRVIADTIVQSSKDHRLIVQCDDRIPIGVNGAVFRCNISADDGSTARIQYTMNRAGAYSADVLDSTDSRHRVAPTDDDDVDGEDPAPPAEDGTPRDPWK